MRRQRAFYTSHIGKEAWVLWKNSKVGTPMHGFTDNYIRVEMDHDDQLDNQLIRVRMGGFNEEGTALKGDFSLKRNVKRVSVVILNWNRGRYAP